MQGTSRRIFFDRSELCPRRDLEMDRTYPASQSGLSRISDCDTAGSVFSLKTKAFPAIPAACAKLISVKVSAFEKPDTTEFYVGDMLWNCSFNPEPQATATPVQTHRIR